MYTEIKKTLDKFKSLKLTRTQELLLGKLINFSTLEQFDSEEMRNDLYKLFFEWSKDMKPVKADKEPAKQSDSEENQKEKADAAAAQEDKDEKKKRLMVRLDQELIEFEERGGFAQVLKDIFNPVDQSSMELDSVY